MPKFVRAFVLFVIFQVPFSLITFTSSFQLSLPYQKNRKNDASNRNVSPLTSSTALHGKLWDKLQVEPDPFDEDALWYLMNCVVGTELDLLAQAKHVTQHLSDEYIEKLVVPQERRVRSHGKTQTVVELKVLYPGYVFCKMRLCAETYEPLQQLPLCRSWMAGTVNLKGYKKLPPAPIALSDEEVAKFKGLEEQTDAIYETFGEDYTGRGDDGMDLIGQYEGYRPDNMVKILEGNFKGEDGIVRRLKDGQIMVRLYTYGNVNDQWFKPNEIRPMTDAEAMKGLTGPSAPVNQDEFDVSIGKRPQSRDLGGRGLRSSLNNNLGGGVTRMRRQDRVNRGERGNRDLYGRTEEEMKEEEENWRQYREEQRASQQQKRGDVWGIKERSSWDSGDDAAQYSDGKWKSGRQMRREKKNNPIGGNSQNLNNAIDGGGEWDFFSDNSSGGSTQEKATDDDFFTSLMSELSDTLAESSSETSSSGNHETKMTTINNSDDGDDFFNSLMSELSETLDASPTENHELESEKKTRKEYDRKGNVNREDDFFKDLMFQLSDAEAYQNEEIKSEYNMNKGSDDDFFASLEADLNDSLNDLSLSSRESNDDSIDAPDVTNDSNAGLESHFEEVLSEKISPTKKNNQQTNETDFDRMTVAHLKEILRERGLKVSGKKSDLIDRLLENNE